MNKQRGFAHLMALLLVVLVSVVGFGGWFVWHRNNDKAKSINSYQECVNAGYPVQESYPTVCREGNKSFTNPAQAENNIPTTNSETETKPTQTEKTVVVKEWNIKMTYRGNDTYKYLLSTTDHKTYWYASLISKSLEAKFGCDSFGAGQIERTKPNTVIYIDGTNAEQNANKSPKYTKKIGNYYYTWRRDNASCSAPTLQSTESAAIQMKANDATYKIFQSIESNTSP